MNERELRIWSTDLAMGESLRWHDHSLWFCDWGMGKVLRLDSEGQTQTVVEHNFGLPFCIDWLPDGTLLIVSGSHNEVLRVGASGRVETHCDLSPASADGWNEIAVNGNGDIYVNGGRGQIALVRQGSIPRLVASDVAFPNGMAITPDGRTLIVAESHRSCLSAFAIEETGDLSNRRVWAALDGPPDGIHLTDAGTIWYADVPNKRCVLVAEGGKILNTVDAGRGCFCCALGGQGNQELFIATNEWLGMQRVGEMLQHRKGQIVSQDVGALVV